MLDGYRRKTEFSLSNVSGSTSRVLATSTSRCTSCGRHWLTRLLGVSYSTLWSLISRTVRDAFIVALIHLLTCHRRHLQFLLPAHQILRLHIPAITPIWNARRHRGSRRSDRLRLSWRQIQEQNLDLYLRPSDRHFGNVIDRRTAFEQQQWSPRWLLPHASIPNAFRRLLVAYQLERCWLHEEDDCSCTLSHWLLRWQYHRVRNSIPRMLL